MSQTKVTIQFSDTQAGNTADINVVPNGSNVNVKDALEKTDAGQGLIKVGQINTISLVDNFEHVVVAVKNKNQEVVTATGQQTFQEFTPIPVENLHIVATTSK